MREFGRQGGFADWRVAACIDADVDHAVFLRPLVVHVAVNEPRTVINRAMFHEAVVVVAVASVREVAEHGVDVADSQRCRSLHDLGEPSLQVPVDPWFAAFAVTEPAAIVIACDEDLAATQLGGQRERFGDLAEREIAEHPDCVGRPDDRIPVVDQPTVHMIDVSERAAAVFDDVVMAEV